MNFGMGVLRVALVVGFYFVFNQAMAATAVTQLESTPVRSKASALGSSLGSIPSGTTVSVLGTSGSFTEVEYTSGGKKMKGFIPSASIASSGSKTANLGTGTKKKTSFGKNDVAAAINSAAKNETSTAMMEYSELQDTADSAASDAMVAQNDLSDFGDDLAETGSALATDAADTAVGTATDAVAAKKKQVADKKAELEAKKKELTAAPMNAVNAKKKELADKKAELEAKKNELTAAPMNAVNAKKKELADKKAELEAKKNELSAAPTNALDSKKKELAAKKAELEAKKNELSAAPMNAVNAKKQELDAKKAALQQQGQDKVDEFNDTKAEIESMGDMFTMENGENELASAAAPVTGAARRASATADMSAVDSLDALEISRDEFSAGSSFVREGQLKSKTLK